MWPTSHLGVPAGLNQTQKRLNIARQRGPLIRHTVAVVVITLVLGDQRIQMRLQRRIELRRLHVRKLDSPTTELLIGAPGDRGPRIRPKIRFGFGSRFQLERGPQLIHRGNPGQLRIMRIRTLTRPPRDHPNLIQRQPPLPHTPGAARKLRQPPRHRGDRVGVARRAAHLPGHQPRHRPRPRHTPQPVAIQLSHDLHNAPINRIALTGQLRQLLKQHLHTLGRTDYRCARRRGRGHEFIIAAGSDNSGQPESTPGAVPSSPRKEMLGSGSAPAGAKGTRDNEISEPTMETLNGVGREAGEMLGAAGGHRIDRPQTQPARLQPSTRLATKSHACQRIPVYFPVCFQSLIRPMAKS